MPITHLFFDIGGVLGSDGWDWEQRANAARHFGLALAELEERHEMVVAEWEQGKISLEDYLGTAVFSKPREFTRADFRAFILAQSRPHADTIALAGALARTGRYHLMTINNESAELNQHRLAQFGLPGVFEAFFSSCWLGALKPAPRIYELAIAISQATPSRAVFIDDREANLGPARSLGMQVIHYSGAVPLRGQLAALGVHL